MVVTIENKYLNIVLIVAGTVVGIMMGFHLLGDGSWWYKLVKVSAMFTVMVAAFYIFKELNAVKLTQTGIQLAFSKEIPYKEVIAYQEKNRITSANGRALSRKVFEVTTADGTRNIPLHTNKQIFIDAIQAGKRGDGAALVYLLQSNQRNTITFGSTALHFSFVLVVSIIPLLIVSIAPKKNAPIFDTNLLEVEKGARQAIINGKYEEAYSITKHYLTMYGATKNEECVLYEILKIAEKNLDVTERFPRPLRCE